MLMQSQSTGENILLIQGADILRQLLNTFPLPAMKDFVTFWLATGANLALAEPFTEQCTEDMTRLFTSFSQEENWHLAYAQRLTQNSREPLKFSSTSDIENFSAQFLDQKFRWESLGIFPVSYTHLRAHETDSYLVCRLLLEKKKYAVFCLKKKNSFFFFFFLMIRRQPRSTHCISSAASDVYKRQSGDAIGETLI